MFKHLYYKVTFASPAPGRTMEQDLEFAPGLTAITGRNGSGKSMILEMIQYALFGSVALRGKGDDYLDLQVKLDFEVREKKLQVHRSKKEVRLYEDGVPVATGVKPVNEAIVKYLGYGYEVFQVGNAANQGAIEKLGQMLPTERKKLVDETIGLNVLEEITAYIQQESRDVASSIRTMESLMVLPPEVVQVEGYQQSKVLQEKLAEIQSEHIKYTVLESRAKQVIPGPATEPVGVPSEDDINALVAHQAERRNLLQEKGWVEQQIAAIPEPLATMVDTLEEDDGRLEEYEKEEQARRDLKSQMQLLETKISRLPKSSHPEEDIANAEKVLVLLQRWQTREELRSKRVPHDCPACNHHWEDEDPRLQSDFEGVPEEKPVLLMTQKQIVEARTEARLYAESVELAKQWNELADRLVLIEEREADIKRIRSTREAFSASALSRANQERKKQLQERLNELSKGLENFPDRSLDLETAQKLAKLHNEWKSQAALRADVAAAKEALSQMPTDLAMQWKTTESLLQASLRYEIELEAYTFAKAKYEENAALLEQKRAELQDWENSRKAVAELRTRVKAFLLPSLNKVATYLLNEMTGGQLRWLVVSDEFEITVDGQRLELLSGAGKAVANLALRLALGQVLTNRVLSSVLLDEVDASMEDERAAYVAKCLKNLTHTIRQVFIVSHKPETEADQHIRV